MLEETQLLLRLSLVSDGHLLIADFSFVSFPSLAMFDRGETRERAREREVNGVVVGDMSYEEDGREGSVIKGGGGGG